MKLLAIIAAILAAGAAAAEPIIIRVTAPDGTVATTRITKPREVTNLLAKVEAERPAGDTNTTAAALARHVAAGLVAQAYEHEQRTEDAAEDADRRAKIQAQDQRRAAREAARQAALQEAGGQ